MSYLDVSAAGLKRWEGDIPWMYRDSSLQGWVTVAIGEMIQTAAGAAALPFLTPAGVPATDLQIRGEYARVAGLPRGHLASFYRWSGSLTLPQVFRDSRLQLRQKGFEAQLRLLFPGIYETFPDNVKVALIDMAYNLGLGKLEKYEHLVAALRSRNYAGAETNCTRGGISPDRNQWTMNLFASAV